MKHTSFALVLFVLFIGFQTTSCTWGNKYVKETRMLDSMLVFVAKADSAVKTMDSVKISNYAHQVEKDDELIKMAKVDSMSSVATDIFRNFNMVRWSLLTAAGKRGPLIRELEKSQQQITRLSHDLQHNSIKADSAAFYVSFETKRASELIEVADISINDVSKQTAIYTILLPKTDSLMNLLQEHKKF
jgi:hypothetical protein